MGILTNESQELRKLEYRLNDQFIKAFAKFKLLEDGDHILIGLSGGKDSLLLTELLARRSRIQHPRFSVEALHVRMANVSYETDTTYLEQFCSRLDIPLHVVTTGFDVDTPYDATDSDAGEQTAARLRKQKQPCFLCSWNRRKQLFNKAQELGCNKIALGHHQDDILHTALMNLTFQSHFSTMPVRLKMKKMPLTIIRPLCLCQEKDIRRYAELLVGAAVGRNGQVILSGLRGKIFTVNQLVRRDQNVERGYALIHFIGVTVRLCQAAHNYYVIRRSVQEAAAHLRSEVHSRLRLIHLQGDLREYAVR